SAARRRGPLRSLAGAHSRIGTQVRLHLDRPCPTKCTGASPKGEWTTPRCGVQCCGVQCFARTGWLPVASEGTMSSRVEATSTPCHGAPLVSWSPRSYAPRYRVFCCDHPVPRAFELARTSLAHE